MAIDILIDYTVNDLQEVTITDATDSVGSVNGVRMLFSTVNSVAAETPATVCLAWYEYEVLTGTAVVNGVSYTAGRKILLANNTTPTGTFTMQTTGRYGQYISDNLPSSGLPYVFTPEQTGRPAFDTIYFTDEVFVLDYDQYTTVYVAGQALVAGTYLVVGTGAGSVLVNGTKRIYIGETYTSLGSETFTGASRMVLYSDSAQFYFATTMQSFDVYQLYLTAKANAINPSQKLDSNLLYVAALYGSVDIAAEQSSGISLDQIQINLNQINEYYSAQL
jgi:hypothetical protein